MKKITPLFIFEILIALLLVVVGAVIVFSNDLVMPSPFGGRAITFSPPATYCIAYLPFAFSVLIFLRYFSPNLAKKIGPFILLSAFFAFVVGSSVF